MTAVRADWHVTVANVETSDPFAAVPAFRDPEVMKAETFQRLRELVRAEGRIDRTCELKDRDWANPSCIRCPERGSRGPLCGIGVAQEEIVGRLESSADAD